MRLGRGGLFCLQEDRCFSTRLPLSPFVPHGERECRSPKPDLPGRGVSANLWRMNSMPQFGARVFALLAAGPGLCVSLNLPAAEKPEALFVATPLTEEGAFTEGIEGPACDAQGNIYAVNFARQQTIGKTTPDGKSEVFVTLPGKSTGNGIVFDPAGTMYVADYVGHNVLRIDMKTREISVFAHNDKMNQPNDLAIAPNGTLY